MQPVEIPKLPSFCNRCKGIGHAITQCRGLRQAFQGARAQGNGNSDKKIEHQNVANRNINQQLKSKETQVENPREEIQLTGQL